jgi:hypothetical protein
MSDDEELVELKCKFCSGRLKPDEPVSPPRDASFRFFAASSATCRTSLQTHRKGEAESLLHGSDLEAFQSTEKK